MGPPDLRQMHGVVSFGDDLTVSRGAHALKFGVLFNHIRDEITLPVQHLGLGDVRHAS